MIRDDGGHGRKTPAGRGWTWVRAGVLLLLLAAAPRTILAQPFLINEFMAANSTSVADPDFRDYADWLEIYNPSPSSADLDGLFLTDDLGDPHKWPIPAGLSVPAGGYVVFWADDQNIGFHTNFRLSAGGESIGLFDVAGDAVDVITFGPQSDDVSSGRVPDGADEIRFLGQPTPGTSNGLTGFLGVAEPPEFSIPGGFYAAGTDVILSTGLSAATVHFTTDGTLPTPASPPYERPITVSSTTVLRAAVFGVDYVPSRVRTHTYLIGESRPLPVVSLSTDPANFFDDEIGIYVTGTNGIPGYCRSIPLNWNQDWERPIHVEFFEPDGSLGFSMDAGVKIHGGCTRLYPQKSLALYARRMYGFGRIDYPIFKTRDLPSYNNLVLRSSAQDWWRTMFRDGMIQTVIEKGMQLETQAYRPSVVFLNGEYWGIHNLREKQNEHYFADRSGADPNAIEILEGDKHDVLGQSEHYDEMMDFMFSTDMTHPEVLETIDSYMDVDAYIDYLVAEIYSANADWPGNNLKLWRPIRPGGRWRWVIFDLDMGFGGNANAQYHSNTLALATDPNGQEWPNPPWSTLLLRTLLENPDFRNEFIQRFAAHMNTTFAPENVLPVIDSLRARIADEIPRHMQRWPESISYTPTWEDGIDIMREFAIQRPRYVRPHFYDYFDLSGSSRLTLVIDEPEGGQVLAHGVPMPAPAFDAVFFRDVPVRLQAVPHSGYRFDGWTGASTGTADTTSILLTGNATLTATFSRDGSSTAADTEVAHDDRLLQNYPNPFSATTRITFELARPSDAQIDVTDVLGRRVAVLADGPLPSGVQSVMLDATPLPAGVYFYTMSTPGARITRKMLLVR